MPMTNQRAANLRQSYIADNIGASWDKDFQKVEFVTRTFSNKNFADLLHRERFLRSDAGKSIHGESAKWKLAIVSAQLDYLARLA